MHHSVEIVIVTFSMILSFALWLEYRHLCRCKARKNNPYELIDLQREMQEQKEKENG
jgi:hypothetical protein